MHSLYMCKVRLSMHTQHNQINSCSILCSPTKGLDESLKITHLPIMLNLIDKESGSWESMSVLGNHYIIVSSLGSWGGIITYLFIQANLHLFFLLFFRWVQNLHFHTSPWWICASPPLVLANSYIPWPLKIDMLLQYCFLSQDYQAWYASYDHTCRLIKLLYMSLANSWKMKLFHQNRTERELQ